jgi:hypothetical protein
MRGTSLRGITNINATGSCKRVCVVELDMEFNSFKDCAHFLNVTPHTISKYFQGEVKTVKGYTLKKI